MRWCFSGLLLLGCPGDDGTTADTDTDTGGIESIGNTMAATGMPSSGMGSEETGPPACGETEFQLDALPTKVMLVLDKSASMVEFTWDHDDDGSTEEVTRWFSLHETVANITTTFEASIEFGAMLYPSEGATSDYNEDACVVASEPEVSIAPNNAQNVLDGIPPANAMNQIQGGTPSRAAVEAALAHLSGFDSSQPRALLFVTDGEANCPADWEEITDLFEVYDQALHDVVADAFETQATPTYVVGIAIRDQTLGSEIDGTPDGINPSNKLDQLAEAGGRPRSGDGTKYYATTNQMELEAALSEIVAQEFSCQVPLDPVPEHPERLEVIIDGEAIEQVTDCATEDGWRYPNADGPYDVIELCGAACSSLATTGTLRAIYGCPPAG